jgi:hypothetical protein
LADIPPGSNSIRIPSQTINVPNIPGVTDITDIQIRIITQASASGVNEANSWGSVLSATAELVTAASLVISQFPYQYAWSAAEGQYSIFNPQTVQGGVTVVTGAGFNNLPDVEDEITGLFNTGPTEFVLRSQGITEVTPLNNGIEPFDFNHLWASHKGIGTVYPNTVGQYGGLGQFLSDTDIFSFGYEGINTASGKATSAIYEDLIGTCQGNQLSGGLGPLYINGEVYLAYILTAVLPTAPYTMYTWLLNTKTKEWYRFQINLPAPCVGIEVIAVNLGTISQTDTNCLYIIALQSVGGNLAWVFTIPIDGSLTNTAPSPGEPQLITPTAIFPAEEIKMIRDITVDGILVQYNGTEIDVEDILNIGFSISGVDTKTNTRITIAFQAINLANTNVRFDGTNWYIALSPTLGRPFTGNSPQLIMQPNVVNDTLVTALLAIGKIVLLASYDSTQRPL